MCKEEQDGSRSERTSRLERKTGCRAKCSAPLQTPAQGPWGWGWVGGGVRLGKQGDAGDAPGQPRRGEHQAEPERACWKPGFELGLRGPFRVFGQEGQGHPSVLAAGSGERWLGGAAGALVHLLSR